MDEKEKGKIALLLIKNQIKEKGVRISQNLRRDIGNEAKNIGIPTDELMKFMEVIVREMVEEAFTKK